MGWRLLELGMAVLLILPPAAVISAVDAWDHGSTERCHCGCGQVEGACCCTGHAPGDTWRCRSDGDEAAPSVVASNPATLLDEDTLIPPTESQPFAAGAVGICPLPLEQRPPIRPD